MIKRDFGEGWRHGPGRCAPAARRRGLRAVRGSKKVWKRFDPGSRPCATLFRVSGGSLSGQEGCDGFFCRGLIPDDTPGSIRLLPPARPFVLLILLLHSSPGNPVRRLFTRGTATPFFRAAVIVPCVVECRHISPGHTPGRFSLTLPGRSSILSYGIVNSSAGRSHPHRITYNTYSPPHPGPGNGTCIKDIKEWREGFTLPHHTLLTSIGELNIWSGSRSSVSITTLGAFLLFACEMRSCLLAGLIHTLKRLLDFSRAHLHTGYPCHVSPSGRRIPRPHPIKR